MPLRRLDAEARAVIDLANDIAYEYGLEYVGTEHILLAILRHADNMGARVLGKFGMNEDKIRAKVDELVQRAKEDTWVFGRLPGEVWKDTEGIETVRHFAANVANLVKKLHPETSN